MSQISNDDIRTAVRDTYSQIAVSDTRSCCAPSASSCCGLETPVQIGSTQLGYSEPISRRCRKAPTSGLAAATPAPSPEWPQS